MPSLHELIQQQDPAALRLKLSLEARIAAAKASDRVKAASTLLDEATQVEEQARTRRDGLLADLQQRLDALGQEDELGRAQLALERAKLNAAYKPAANALCKAQDVLADTERDLKAAMADVQKYPLPAPEPEAGVIITAG